MELTPIFRIEKFLDAIINSTTPPEPVFRVEYFLAKIAGADVVTPDPLFRIEKYLAKICGEDVEIPDPVFRIEFWLAKKCGEDVETPEPAFRIEYWLEEWCGGSAPTYETITGKIVSFLTQRIAPLKIEASLSPIQDLHGYDAPWPPGGGKNKLPQFVSTETTSNGLTITPLSNGGVRVHGKSTATSATLIKMTSVSIPLPAGTYTFSCGISDSSNKVYAQFVYGSGSTFYSRYTPQTKIIDADTTITRLDIGVNISSGEDIDVTLYIQLELGSPATAFAPYSNICPISGHSGAEIYVEDEYDAQADPTVQISFGSTVYGGTLTVNEDGTGTLTETHKLISPWSFTFYPSVGTETVNARAGHGSTIADTPTTELKCQSLIPVAYSTAYANRPLYSFAIKESQYYPLEIKLPLEYDTSAKIKTYLESIDAKMYVKIKEPQTITLSAEVVNALQGQNVVWLSTPEDTDIKVTYRSN